VPKPFDSEDRPKDGRLNPRRQVSLVKGGQQYVFRYIPGEEVKLLNGLADMARDPNCELNWFDAAVLSHQMGQSFGQQLEQILKS
jgi:hypothetical protein